MFGVYVYTLRTKKEQGFHFVLGNLGLVLRGLIVLPLDASAVINQMQDLRYRS